MDRRFRIYPAGDAALVIEMGRRIDLQINRQVHHLAGLLTQARLPGIGEAVPAYASLMVHYDPAILDYGTVRGWVENALPNWIRRLSLNRARWRSPRYMGVNLARTWPSWQNTTISRLKPPSGSIPALFTRFT